MTFLRYFTKSTRRSTLGWFCLIGLLLASQSASAKEISLIAAPRDFALKEPDFPPPISGPLTYAITGGNPNWYIVAWGIPGGKLSSFAERRIGGKIVFSSRAAEAAVEIVHLPNGQVAYQLLQDGTPLPCEENGQPRESDLLTGPNGQDAKSPEIPGLLLPPNKPLSLLTLTHLVATATVTVQSGPTGSPKGCGVSQGSALISVLLNNPMTRQTLFYKVVLINVCGPQPKARSMFCARSTQRPWPVYYFRTNPFGVADPLPLVGERWLANNERRTIRLDLLPRLIEHIRTGPNTMDHEPSHWNVTGYYNGQNIWGDVTLTSQWEDVDLLATMR